MFAKAECVNVLQPQPRQPECDNVLLTEPLLGMQPIITLGLDNR